MTSQNWAAHGGTRSGLGETDSHRRVLGEYSSGRAGWPSAAQLNGIHGKSAGSRADSITG